jgi:peptidoglycan/LPS O-acetylase OafA/YrhL
MYIFAFPVQQLLVLLGRNQGWSLGLHFFLSVLLTSALAYASWHGLEKQALRLKPS